MKTNILLSTIISVVALCMVSCDDFLSKAPSKEENLEIKTVEQLEALIANHNSKSKSIESNKIALYSSDNFEYSKELYKTPKQIMPSMALYQYYTWNMELASDDSNDTGWGDYFDRIYNANLIINEIDKASGRDDDKRRLKAEAHFIRAHNYLSLASIYCLPYGPATKQEDGLPLKRSTSFEERLDRVSLEETYDFIENDIKEALKIDVSLYRDDLRRTWRANKAAACALASRFYLLKGMYAEAEKYADMALKEDDTLIDYTSGVITQKAEVGLDENMMPIMITFPSTWTNRIDDLTFSRETDMYYQKSIITFVDLCWLIPSRRLLNLYDQEHDLRYRYFIVPQFSYTLLVRGAFPGYCTYNHEITSGLSVAEMLLIKAECMVRTGQNVAGAMDVLNRLRDKRISKDAPAEVRFLSASDKQEALRLVLDERSREMPFTMRWSDIRRCNFNEDPSDDITITRSFYDMDAYKVKDDQPKEYTLAPGSRRYAAPIPKNEITSAQGVIKQNRY